jgi:hypothetical protein
MRSQIEWITTNVASLTILLANVFEALPTLVGVVGGLAVAWYNIEKAVSVRKNRNKDE